MDAPLGVAAGGDLDDGNDDAHAPEATPAGATVAAPAGAQAAPAASAYEPPRPIELPATSRSQRSVRRVQTVATFTRHLGPVLARRAARRPAPAAEVGRRLRRAFEALGSTYVKFGQLVGSSPGAFGPEVADEFRSCLDTGPPVPFSAVRAAIETTTGQALGDVFAHVEEHPIAAASIAVVHRARLRDGRDVAVKVLRPGIAEQVTIDLDVMEPLFRRLALQGVGVAGPLFRFLRGFRTQIAEELDLRNEARTMTHFAALFAEAGLSQIVVPRPASGLSGRDVLVMDFLDGVAIDDLDAIARLGHDPGPLVRDLLRSWFLTGLRDGMFHGDIHAGNLLLLRDGRVGMLDWGIVGRLDTSTHRLFRRFVEAVLGDQSAWPEIVEFLRANAPLPVDAETSDGRRLADAAREEIEGILTRPFGEGEPQGSVQRPGPAGRAHRRPGRSLARRAPAPAQPPPRAPPAHHRLGLCRLGLRSVELHAVQAAALLRALRQALPGRHRAHGRPALARARPGDEPRTGTRTRRPTTGRLTRPVPSWGAPHGWAPAVERGSLLRRAGGAATPASSRVLGGPDVADAATDYKVIDRKIGLIGGIVLMVGTVIGISVFLLPGVLIGDAGPSITIALLITAIPMAFSIMMLLQLGGAMPVAGGVYVYASRLISPVWGTIVIALVIPGIWAVLLFTAFGFAEFVRVLVDIPAWILMAGVLTLFMALNLRGMTFVATVQLVMVGAIVLGFLAFIVPGAFQVEAANYTPMFPEGTEPFILAVVALFIPFQGYSMIVELGEELHDPIRNIPRVLIYGMALAVVLSLGLVVVFTGLDDYRVLGDLGDGGVAEAASEYIAGWVGGVVAFAAILGAFTTLNAIITSYSRTLMRAARDNVISPWLAQIHGRTGVPHWAIIVLSAPPILLIPVNPGPVVLPVFLALVILFGGFMSAIALWNLPKRFPNAYQNSLYKLPMPLLKVASIGSAGSAAVFWLAVAPQAIEIIAAIAAMGVAGACYHAYRSRKEREFADRLARLDEHEAAVTVSAPSEDGGTGVPLVTGTD